MFQVNESQKRCNRMCLQTRSVVRERAQLRLTLMLTGTIAMFIVGHVPIAFEYTVIFEAVFGEDKVGGKSQKLFRSMFYSTTSTCARVFAIFSLVCFVYLRKVTRFTS